VLEDGRRVGTASGSQPPIGLEDVLVGIVLHKYHGSVDAIAIDVTAPLRYAYFCIDKKYPETLTVELYALLKSQASKMSDAIQVTIIDFSNLAVSIPSIDFSNIAVPVKDGRPYRRSG